MAWTLRKEYTVTHPKTGEPHTRVTYHMGFGLSGLFQEGSSRAQDAREFRTKTLAEVYARNKLPGQGYKPEKVN